MSSVISSSTGCVCGWIVNGTHQLEALSPKVGGRSPAQLVVGGSIRTTTAPARSSVSARYLPICPVIRWSGRLCQMSPAELWHTKGVTGLAGLEQAAQLPHVSLLSLACLETDGPSTAPVGRSPRGSYRLPPGISTQDSVRPLQNPGVGQLGVANQAFPPARRTVTQAVILAAPVALL